MKRMLSVLLVCSLCLALFPVSAFGAEIVPAQAIETVYEVSQAVASKFTVSDNKATANEVGATLTFTVGNTTSATSDAEIYLYDGMHITAKVGEQETSVTASSNGYYALGRFDFTAGGTVTITANNTNRCVGALRITEREEYIFYQADASVSAGVTKSGTTVAGYKQSVNWYGAGTTINMRWDVPTALNGAVDIYYYIPSVGNAETTEMGVKVNLLNAKSETEESFCHASAYRQAHSWLKIGTVYLDGSAKTVQVTGDAHTGVTRFSAIKLVPNAYESYAISPDNFHELGSWLRDSSPESYKELMLRSTAVDTDSTTAYQEFEVANGNYYVYVHTGDYPYYRTGSRRFVLKLNGNEFKKTGDSSVYLSQFGTHCYPQDTSKPEDETKVLWAWEKMGYPGDTVAVTDGKLKIELKAKSQYARVDAIVLTRDPYYVPSNDMETAMQFGLNFDARSPYDDKVKFPEKYQAALSSVEEEITLSNAKVSVTFKEGTLSDGTKTVQRQTVTDGVTTNTFEEGFGFLSLFANKTTDDQTTAYYANFRNVFTIPSGSNYEIVTENVFRAGIPEWLVPSSMEKLSDGSVKMTAEGEYAKAEAIWSLAEGDEEPKVAVTYTAKKTGVYSFGMFNNVNEIDKEEVGYILNPFRYQESRYPDPGVLIREATSTTNHTQMTYKMNEAGQEISLGVAADEAEIDNVWHQNREFYDNKETADREAIYIDMYDRVSGFGMGTVGYNGGVQPSIFAPLFGTTDADFEVGTTYTFTYRPLASVSSEGENQGWYKMYAHVATDLRGVYDYRDNFYASMTDTAFNLLNLLKDDSASGWDKDLIGHYNIEDTYTVTNSNPHAYLQYYLLTEDKDLLMDRTLPMMATMLTRSGPHMSGEYTYEYRSEGPINKSLVTSDTPAGNTTFEGAYRLSRGLMPVFRNLAQDGIKNSNIEKGGVNSLKSPAEALFYDYAMGNSDLTNAKALADEYYSKRAFSSASNFVDESTFINISYFPHFPSMMDVYEATGETKYLDAAIEGARRLLPTLRATDMSESKEVMRTADTEELWLETRLFRNGCWWYGNTGYRRGAVLKDYANPTYKNDSEYYRKVPANALGEGAYAPGALSADGSAAVYPEWVTARVGLSLEQFSTCGSRNDNIYMSTFAPELLRLGYHSDDQLMMDLARSSLVGRFANYPGYYIFNYNPTPGLADYPYKGYDTTQFYFHHIPVLLASVQDYLFSNAYVKSDGAIDFPYVRSEGYAWFNNRTYGAEAGKMYDETDMWPWLKEGTVTVDNKQIDWIAGRKNGRAAFALSNAGDNNETVTLTFNADLNVKGTATIYDAEGNVTEATVKNNALTVTVPKKGLVTVAVNGTGITEPAYASIDFDASSDGAQMDMGNSAIGLMYEGETYTPVNSSHIYSANTGYDVKAYALALDPENYMGYIFVGGRSTEQVAFVDEDGNSAVGGGDGADEGIVSTTLKWRFAGEENFNEVTDTAFPYEFFIPAENTAKGIEFNVETTFGDGSVKTLAETATVEPVATETVNNEITVTAPTSIPKNGVELTTNGTGSASYVGQKGVAVVLKAGQEKALGYESFDNFTAGSIENTDLKGMTVRATLKNTGLVEEGRVAEITFADVPVRYVRLNSAQTMLCLELAFADIAEHAVSATVYDANGVAQPAEVESLTASQLVSVPAMTVLGGKITAERGEGTIQIGSFPTGTKFLTAEALDRGEYGYEANAYKLVNGGAGEGNFTFYYNNATISILKGPFGVFTSDMTGKYKVYALRKDTNAGSRPLKANINGQTFRFDTAPTKASDDFNINSWFWDDGMTVSGAIATVDVKTGEPIFVQIDNSSSGHARVEAFAFVPVNESPSALLYEQNLFNHSLLDQLCQNHFEKVTLTEGTATVNGVSVTAKPYTAEVNGKTSDINSVLGGIQKEATVLDAVITADADFDVTANDIFVNGKRVYAASMLPIPQNAVITTAEKEAETAENFAPIRASEVLSATGTLDNKLKYCLTTSKLPGLMQFGDTDSATAFFKGAKLTGFVSLKTNVTTNGGYTVKKGEKLFMQGVPVDAVVRADDRTDLHIQSMLNVSKESDDWVYATENGNLHKEGVFVNEVYDHSNLYLANKNADGKVFDFKMQEGKFLLLANGASLIRIVVANYDENGAFLGVDHVENGYASFFDGYELTLEENQKAFLWNRSMYGNGSFTPLGDIIE
ncbi:MAG: hypothetical protein IJE10_09470 [Clostridia bacterium]|nr:hypothetical protein [Clostridia bacterium]